MDTSKTHDASSELPVGSQSVAKKAFVAYAVIVGTTALLYLIYLLSSVLLQVVVALIVAVALQPLVKFLMRRGLGRAWSVVVTMIVTCLALLIVTSLIVTPFVTQGTKLVENAPQIVSDLVHNEQLRFLNEQYHIVDRVKELSQTQAARLAGVGVPVLAILKNIVGGISSFIIIFVFAFFFLLQGPEIWERLLKHTSLTRAERLRKIGEKISKAVGGFVTGNLLISLIAGTVALIALLILDVPYAFALAALMALFDIIPLVGAALGTIVIGLVALTQGLLPAVIVVAILLLYQLVEGHFIQPLVYSRVISLSPLLIILASVIGAELAGIVGVLLAIPVAAALQIVVTEIIES